MIDDGTLSRAPYRAEQVLRVVMTATEAEVAKATEAGQRRDPEGSTNRSKGTAGAKDEDQQTPGATPAPASEGLQPDDASAAVASPLRGAAASAVTPGAPSSSAQGMTLPSQRVPTHAGPESVESVNPEELLEERLAPEGKVAGELYARLWEHAPYQER